MKGRAGVGGGGGQCFEYVYVVFSASGYPRTFRALL